MKKILLLQDFYIRNSVVVVVVFNFCINYIHVTNSLLFQLCDKITFAF